MDESRFAAGQFDRPSLICLSVLNIFLLLHLDAKQRNSLQHHSITDLPEIETAQPEIETVLPETETDLPEIETALPEIETALPEIKTDLLEIVSEDKSGFRAGGLWQGGLDLQQVGKIFPGGQNNVCPFSCIKC